MKITLGWVEMFSPVGSILHSMGAKALAHDYSIRTAEIEGIEVLWTESRVVVAKVLSTAPHPNSDHLNLVHLSVGTLGERRIVCGAENVREAKYVAVALEGAVLGEDFVIKAAKIRGEESQGMICSIDELGLASDRAPGILELEKHFDTALLESRLGTPFFELPVRLPGISGGVFETPIADTVFEIDNKFITNRPDLFSAMGNAREFGALFSVPFTAYNEKVVADGKEVVEIRSNKVLAYRLERFENVSAGETPFGMAAKLHMAGQPTKFDLVDMTNYVMTELGQPMHAFDADKVQGKVIVREATLGEKILALDGKEYTLAAGDIVIADEAQILAIAGVIGGAHSAVSAETTNILVESATFDPVSVRMTAARIGCRTDASTRYEKSQDPLLTIPASARIRDVLAFLGKTATPVSSFEYLNEAALNHVSIQVSHDFITKKLGREIPESDVKRILEALGFEYESQGEVFSVTVPSWRATKDVSIKEDIAEEIGRVFGYDQIEEQPIPGVFSIAAANTSIEFKQDTLSFFAASGFLEAYTYSFSNTEKDSAVLLGEPVDAVSILNAVSVEYTHMRRSIAPLLLGAARENLKHTKRFAFFEIGKVHHKIAADQFVETPRAAGVAIGWSMKDLRSVLDVYFAKFLPTAKTEVLQGLDSAVTKLPYLHPNRSGRYVVNGQIIAEFGYLHPEVASNFGLGTDAVYFEIEYSDLTSLLETYGEPKFQDFSRFQTIERELNFVLPERTPTGDIAQSIALVDSRIKQVSIRDIYRDEVKVGVLKKSVTFSFRIEDSTKTITDEEALAIQTGVVNALEKEGYILRK